MSKMAYATYEDVEKTYRVLTESEKGICNALLDEAALLIDAYNSEASEDAKKAVSVMVVRRAMPSDTALPIGATQGTITAGSYSQTYTFGNGSTGELYLTRVEKKLLGVSGRVGAHSPLEDM